MADFLTEQKTATRALLVGVQTFEMEAGEGAELLGELRELVENLGITVARSVLVTMRGGEQPKYLIGSGKISGKMAKQVFATMLETGKAAGDIVAESGMGQISDEGALRAACEKAVAANPEAVAKFKSGNDRVFGSFVGFVMKETKGQANPELVNKLLKEALDKA